MRTLRGKQGLKIKLFHDELLADCFCNHVYVLYVSPPTIRLQQKRLRQGNFSGRFGLSRTYIYILLVLQCSVV